jgi:uncharacterized protein (DUF1800 family)
MPATTEQLTHLLRRTGVRVNKQRLAELQTMEIAQAVDSVCDFSVNPPLVIPPVTAGAEWDWGNGVRNNFFDRLANLPNPLEAKLVLFWHGHFATGLGKVGSFMAMVDQYKTIAGLASGPVETLAQAVALDPAMVVYLDNSMNSNGSPNENFARELMELFLLGVNRGYTQNDVREAARAWTGYGIGWNNSGFFYEYHADQHDNGSKTLFGITKAWTGPQMITEICAGSRRRMCAEYLAAKLWSFFAYEKPDASLVSSLADDFESVGLHTLQFLRLMFKRAEFYSDRSVQGRVKSPIEWGAFVIGSLGLAGSDLNMGYETATAGQEFFNPPNVAGWKNNKVWMNSTVFWAMDGIASWASWRAAADTKLNPASRAVLAQVPSMTPSAAVTAVADLFGLTLSATTRQALENWLTTVRAKNGWGQDNTLARLMSMTTEARLA